MRLSELPADELAARLAGDGLCWQVGPFRLRLRSRLPEVRQSIAFLYADFPLIDQTSELVDFDVSVRTRTPLGGGRTIFTDGRPVFANVPRGQTVPLLEWTLNLCVFRRPHNELVLHAAVVERDGRAAILPGRSGDGKSTLCAALVHRGWRLLSDEVAVVRSTDRGLIPVPRAISLKEESIDVIARFAPEARIGPRWPGTMKGTVAHVVPSTDCVDRADETARPAWLIFPRFRAGSPTELTRADRARALVDTAEESFNYTVLGTRGFETLADLCENCNCHDFAYGDLDEAVAAFDELPPPTDPGP